MATLELQRLAAATRTTDVHTAELAHHAPDTWEALGHEPEYLEATRRAAAQEAR